MKKTNLVLTFILANCLTATALGQDTTAVKSGASARRKAPAKKTAAQLAQEQQLQQLVQGAPPKSKRAVPSPRPPPRQRPVAPAPTPIPPPVQAAPMPTAPPSVAPPESVTPAPTSEISGGSRDSYFEPGVRVTLSQEVVEATRTTTTVKTENMLTQSQGTTLSFKLKVPANNIRWVWTYGFEFALGTIRFKGTTSDIPDQVINPWYMFVFNPGVLYRTAPTSSFGISFPMGYRIIKWPIDDSTLTVSRAAGLGYGAQFTMLTHFSLNSSLHISFTHQLAWPATVWAVGYEYAFR